MKTNYPKPSSAAASLSSGVATLQHIPFLRQKATEKKKRYRRPPVSKHLKEADVQTLHTQFIATTKPGDSNEMAVLGKHKGLFMGMLLPVLWGSLPFLLITGKANEKVRRAFNFAESRSRSGRGNVGKRWISPGLRNLLSSMR